MSILAINKKEINSIAGGGRCEFWNIDSVNGALCGTVFAISWEKCKHYACHEKFNELVDSEAYYSSNWVEKERKITWNRKWEYTDEIYSKELGKWQTVLDTEVVTGKCWD